MLAIVEETARRGYHDEADEVMRVLRLCGQCWPAVQHHADQRRHGVAPPLRLLP
jgi:hypothetical protein